MNYETAMLSRDIKEIRIIVEKCRELNGKLKDDKNWMMNWKMTNAEECKDLNGKLNENKNWMINWKMTNAKIWWYDDYNWHPWGGALGGDGGRRREGCWFSNILVSLICVLVVGGSLGGMPCTTSCKPGGSGSEQLRAVPEWGEVRGRRRRATSFPARSLSLFVFCLLSFSLFIVLRFIISAWRGFSGIESTRLSK